MHEYNKQLRKTTKMKIKGYEPTKRGMQKKKKNKKTFPPKKKKVRHTSDACTYEHEMINSEGQKMIMIIKAT